MESIIAEVAYPINAIVGEGSLWDVDNQRLLWVDILDHKIYSFDPKTNCNFGFDLGRDIGTVVITKSGLWAYADQDGIGFFDPRSGQKIEGTKPEAKHPEIRFNDGKCDSRGTFWAGTMAYDCKEGEGILYEFHTSGTVSKKLTGLTISNGLVWDSTKTKFYFIDSTTYEIHGYHYDFATGNIQNKSVVAKINKNLGLPDGMAIDSDDHLWVALFGGGKVIRIDPKTGSIVFEVIVPAPNVTSCAFGGTNLKDLYITSANYNMDKKALEEFPNSGSLFKAEVPFKGVLPFKMNN